MKYRSRFEIIAVMLQSAVGGATKTRLMYEAFLSHNQMVEYLEFLLRKNLLALTSDAKHYMPTERGMRFLKMYAEIKDAVVVGKSNVLTMGNDPSLERDEAIDEIVGPSAQGNRQNSDAKDGPVKSGAQM